MQTTTSWHRALQVVTPAKAGVHPRGLWIPACAGMTSRGACHFFSFVRMRMKSGTGILPVRPGGIGILPMIHGLEAHATLNRVFIHVLRGIEGVHVCCWS